MTWLKEALAELFGLFVDDVPFTLAIVAWLVLAVLLAGVLPWLDGPVLAVGLAALLLGGVARTARAKRGR